MSTILEGKIYEPRVNNPKRSRDDRVPDRNSIEVIDLISDDEGPTAKRQKSIPPPTERIEVRQVNTPVGQPHATPGKVQDQQSISRSKVENHVPKSPFRNRPGWLVTGQSQHKSSDIGIVPFYYANNAPKPANIPGKRGEPPNTSQSQPNGSRSATTQVGSGTREGDFKIHRTGVIRFNTHSNDSVTTARATTSGSYETLTRHPIPFIDVPVQSVSRELPVRSSGSATEHRSSSQTSTPFQTSLFHRPSVSSRDPKIVVNIPQRREKQIRRDLVEQLKRNTDLAIQDPSRVEEILGLNGFSSVFKTDDKERMQILAQAKKRKVDPSKTGLEILPRRRNPRKPSSGNSIEFIHPRDQVKDILTDRFGEKVNPPLTFINDKNDHRIDGKFQFIKDYIIRRGVKTTGGIPRLGCSRTCLDGQCGFGCSCMGLAQTDGTVSQPTATSYWRRADGLVVLTEDQINESSNRAEIIECDDGCPCSSDCINRVVQKGRTVPLEIFETGKYGFGVRSDQNIVRGQFIEIYLGEVLTEAELNRREDAAEEGQSSYVYSLDWFSSQNAYQIDGQNFGSAMRFVNHCCEPNARTFPVMNRKSTRNLYNIAFFAIKDIPAGTEIRIDYVPQNALAEDEDEDTDSIAATMGLLNLKHDEGVTECLCGAPNCRRRLWGGPKRKGRKRLLGELD